MLRRRSLGRVLRPTTVLLLLSVVAPHVAFAQGNSWDKVRYNGGTVATKVEPDDWDNTLTVTSNEILFKLKDGQSVSIDPAKVSSISYGQEAHRRVGTMIALGIIFTPVALFGLFHKTKLHFIGMDYETADGKKAGILLQGHKDNYRAVLLALSSVTGKPVAVDEKDRKEIPANVQVNTVAAANDAKPVASTGGETVAVKLTSTPDGADITVDGAFVGNAPSQIKLAAGKHTIKVTSAGFKDWEREINVSPGSEVTLNAALEKAP